MFFKLMLLMIPIENGAATMLSDNLYQALNSIVGHSQILDSLISLPLENNLVKAGLVGACFMYVWLGGKTEAEIFRRRKILLITLISMFFVIGITKTLSKSIFLPRPYVQSQKAFHLDGDRLVESEQLNYRVPLDEESRKIYKELERGEIQQNDLGSFPSDHAGFFMAFAVGILLACRSVGLLALGWTLIVALGSRVVTGQHSPLDIAAGAGIGVVILLALQFFVGRLGKRAFDPVVNWTLKNSAPATAIIFICVFEATNTLKNIRPILKIGKDAAKQLLGG